MTLWGNKVVRRGKMGHFEASLWFLKKWGRARCDVPFFFFLALSVKEGGLGERGGEDNGRGSFVLVAGGKSRKFERNSFVIINNI